MNLLCSWFDLWRSINSFDDIQFFHTFSSISRDIFTVTLNEIHRFTWNFMCYKMIYFLSHKFTSKNLRFSPFYEHFRQLREKCAFKLLIKYIMIISSVSSFWWCAYLQMFFKKQDTSFCILKPTHYIWPNSEYLIFDFEQMSWIPKLNSRG